MLSMSVCIFLLLGMVMLAEGFVVNPVKTEGLATTRTIVLEAGPAVLEPPVKEKVKEKKAEDTKQSANTKRGGWAVRLFNDPTNKREFVAMCLAKVCGLSDGQSYQVMMQAHKNGVAVVGRYDYERAEMYRDSLLGEGLVSDMIPVEDD